LPTFENKMRFEIAGSHGGDYDDCLLGFDVWSL
jgi:hypothetical protein